MAQSDPHETPSQVSGPAFPVTVKWLASALMLGLLVWGWLASGEIAAAGLSTSGVIFLGTALLVILLCYGAMLTSQTTISTTHIRQTWLWRKEVALADITQVKLIQIPGMAWLIVPRLVLRVGSRGLYTFHAGDPEVQRIFVRLARGSSAAALMQDNTP